MKDRRKENKYLFFFKIWMVHIIVYYYTWGAFYHTINYQKNKFSYDQDYYEKILFGPLVGIIGFYDGFMFFFIIPVILMAFFIKMRFTTKWFFLYIISLLLSYTILWIGKILYYLYPYNLQHVLYELKNMEFDEWIINTIPSLIVVFILNWLLFKRLYCRINEK